MRHDIPEALRLFFLIRAQGCCEYCLFPDSRSGFSHQVDHIVSRKHGGTSVPENLAYCCVFCNRHKGSDVAGLSTRTGEAIRLFNPRLQRWRDHFRIHGGIIEPLTAEGDVTSRILRLNHAERVVERLNLQRLGLYSGGR